MPSAPCPKCQTPTASVLGKTFCPTCGWNRDAAEKRTRLLLRLLPVLVIIFDAPLILWVFVGHAQLSILGLLGLLALIPAVLVAIAVRGRTRLQMNVPASSITPASSGSRLEAPEESADDSYAALAQLQKPRQVRMSSQGRMNVAVICVGVLVLAGVLIVLAVVRPRQTGGPPPAPIVYVIPIILLVLVAMVMRRSLIRQKQLLAYGEVAEAQITKDWTARNGTAIRYEFTPPGGKSIFSVTTDPSRALSAGKTVPVFYDPENPENQVALCGAFYEFAKRKRPMRARS